MGGGGLLNQAGPKLHTLNPWSFALLYLNPEVLTPNPVLTLKCQGYAYCFWRKACTMLGPLEVLHFLWCGVSSIISRRNKA